MEDTVEHRVDGLAEKIIAEDAERRQQDLVRVLEPLSETLDPHTHAYVGPLQHRAETAKLGFETGTGQEACQARAQNPRVDTHPHPCVPFRSSPLTTCPVYPHV